MEEALLDHQAAGDDLLAHMLFQPVDRAIGVPGNIGEKLERMAADRIAEQLLFGAKALKAVRLRQRRRRQALEIARRQKPALRGRRLCATRNPRADFKSGFELPILGGPGLAKVIESPDANEGFHLLRQRLNAETEIRQRRKFTLLALAQNGLPGALGQSFHEQNRNANAHRGPGAGKGGRRTADGKRRPRIIDGRRQQGNPQPVTFQDIDQRTIKAFAVGEHRRHKFSGIMQLEPRGLIGLDAVRRAVRFTERVATKTRHQFPNFGDVALGSAAPPGAVGKLDLDARYDFGFIFAQGAPENIRAPGGQPGEGLANLEDMFLVNHQAVRAAQAGFERGMRIAHRAEPLVTPGKLHFLAFIGRARTNHGDDGNQGIDIPRVAHAAQGNHRRTFDMMHRPRAPAGNQLPDFRILERPQGRRHSELWILERGRRTADGFKHVAHDRKAALGENVHLDQAHGFDGVHIEMGRGIAFGRQETGSDLVHRLAREHQAARMHLGIARKTIQEVRHPKRRRVRLLVPGQVAAIQRAGHRLGQFAGLRKMGQPLGEPAHLVFRNPQHLGHLGKRAAGLKRGKAADHRGMGRTVLLKNQIDHIIFAVVREIDIDVRQFVERHAVPVKKAAKIQIETNGADVADFQAVTGERIRRAAAGDPLDPAPAALLQNIPHDQEIFFVAHLHNHRQFLFDLGLEPRVLLRITALQALPDQPPQKNRRSRPVRRRVTGKLRLAQAKRKRTALGNFIAPRQQLRARPEQPPHLGCGPKMVRAAQPLFRVLLAQQGQRADALNHVVLPAIRRQFIMHRQGRDPGPGSRALFESFQAADFQVKAFGKKFGQFRRQADGNEPAGGKGECRRSRWCSREKTRIHPGLGSGRPGESGIQNPAKIVIPGLIFNIQAQAPAAPIEFGANDRLNPRFRRRLRKFHRPVQVIPIG